MHVESCTLCVLEIASDNCLAFVRGRRIDKSTSSANQSTLKQPPAWAAVVMRAPHTYMRWLNIIWTCCISCEKHSQIEKLIHTHPPSSHLPPCLFTKMIFHSSHTNSFPSFHTTNTPPTTPPPPPHGVHVFRLADPAYHQAKSQKKKNKLCKNLQGVHVLDLVCRRYTEIWSRRAGH